jgi:hypothetical protein
MCGDRIDGWWNQVPPQDSRSEPWSMSQKTNSNIKSKTFYERENPKPFTAHVSLDNADTVIEGGPG